MSLIHEIHKSYYCPKDIKDFTVFHDSMFIRQLLACVTIYQSCPPGVTST